MNTTVVFIALVLLIAAGFAVLTAGLVTIDNKVSKIWDTVNEFYKINKGLGDVNSALISAGEKANNTMLDLCDHVKEVIKDNADLIQAIHNLTKDKH